MDASARMRPTILLLALLLMGLSACGSNIASTPSTTPTPGAFSNIPLGSGTDPEPGTDGKPRPTPNGHTESIVVSYGFAYVGSDNGRLYALGNSDGKVHWQYNAGTAVLVFAATNGIVYASGDSTLYAFAANNGTKLWQYRANAFISQVQVADGVVYVNTAAGGDSATLYSLGATDGVLHWRYTRATTMPGLLSIMNGIVYDRQATGIPGDANFTQTVSALRADTSSVLWHMHIDSTDGLINGAAVEVNGIVYIATTHGAIYALHADTGAQVWHAAQSAGQDHTPVPVTPSVVNGVVYIGDTPGMSAYRASDGMRLWQYRHTVPEPGPFGSQPVVVDGAVYFADTSSIVALRAADGSVLWRQKSTSVFMPLTVADGLVINVSGPVSALRASDGSQLWQHDISGSGEGSLAGLPEVVGEGMVYIGSDDGKVQAIRASDGAFLWQYRIQELAVPMDPVLSAYVNFTASISYQQALMIVTSLGLKTFLDCRPYTWSAGDDKDIFSTNHLLTISATVNSAPLWLDRLMSTPGVEKVQASGPHSCPMIRPGSGPRYLSAGQDGTFVRVTFANATQYTTALDATNALGFRQADPCYEQTRAQGKKPTWHSMSQVDSFAKTYTLLLATTIYNATTWQNQLGSIAGVTKIETPYKGSC